MKKLMIAAAAAAMIGGAYADAQAPDYDSVYDYTVNVKTTGAKAGKASPIKYTVKLGQLWWMEKIDSTAAGFEAFANLGMYDQDKAKKILNKLDKLAVVKNLLEFDPEGADDLIDVIKAADDDGEGNFDKVLEFGDDLDGKWCTSFTFKVTPAGGCYRVAKSKKIKNLLLGTCCEDWVFAEKWTDGKVYPYVKDGELTGALQIPLMNFFGALNSEKANKVEIIAMQESDELIGYLAGQGSAKWVADDEVYKISSVSGNIVGEMLGDVCPAGCPECGEIGKAPCFFDCDGVDSSSDLDDDGNSQDLTAAFGTFTIKLNKKLEIGK